MDNLENFFNRCSQIVDTELDKLIPSAETQPARLYEAVRWSVFAGGKRFRPALALAVGNAFGAAEEKLLSTASAIEMIHTYSLIHDDLPAMDNDDLRRGRATCHVKFDEATAILAGDILQTLAFQAIVKDSQLSEKVRVKLIDELAGSAARMVDGQQLDLDGEGKTISIEDLEKIHQNKTGAMISVAARSGAIIAEASEKELEAVTNYASKLGLLFQITDDLLDVTQTTEVLGKTAGKDERAEKATYPSIYGIEETRKLAEKVHAEAVGALAGIEEPTDILREIARFILSRRS
ncbi:MAG TPA: farnesyl diphosphate synthase [Pyrinomonadaceae bacterium]|jgi:geranylgeranyl pyrophosphate synthase|nr:farnesyl diphosphate synthase [Pyrinomonadaceae bacterium]